MLSTSVARGDVRTSKSSRWRVASLIAAHILALIHVAHWKTSGTTMSPVEPSEAMKTLELGYVNAGFVLFALAIAATLVVGRFFCGWVCHLVAYQDFCAWLLGKFGVRPRPFRSRLLVFVPLGAALYMFVWPSVARWLDSRGFPAWHAHFSTDDLWATFPGPIVAAITIAVDGFLIVYLLGSKGFCNYGCPYGAIFGLVDRAAPGRIRVTDACSGCGHCTTTCTSNVRVHEEVARHGMVVDAGCMKCLDCVSVCPEDALYFGFGSPTPAKKSKPRKKTYDFSWSEEFAGAAVFAVALYAFRDLYGAVPLLLALGLSVIAAVLCISFARFVRASDFDFQSLALKRGGRWTFAGALASLAVFATVASVAHSAVVQWHAREGERLLLEAGAEQGATRAELVAASAKHLLAAERLGLVGVGKLELQVGSVLREQKDLDGAAARFRRAIELDPKLLSPRLALADLCIVRRDFDGARSALDGLLALDPSNVEAKRRLDALERVREAQK